MLSLALQNLNSLGLEVVPFGIDESKLKEVKECIVYEYESGTSENKFTLKLRIISPTLLRCTEIKKLIIDKFISISDKSKIDGFTKINLIGGGTMNDKYNNVIHLLMGLSFIGKG